MSLAIQSLSLATASSVFLWTMGGGFDTPLPPLASAATKAPPSEKNPPEKSAESATMTGRMPIPRSDKNPPEKSVESAAASDEAATGTVKLNYTAATWDKVLRDVAKATGSELVMDHIPKGRFSRRDSTKHNRRDAVRILNKDMEQFGFRVIEKGDFLIVINWRADRPQYAPAVLPSKQEQQQPLASSASDFNPPSPYERRIDSITRVDEGTATDSPAQAAPKPVVRKASPGEARPVRQVSHEEPKSEATPAALNDDPLADAAQIIFRPRNRTAVELSRQIYRTFKPRAQLISSGRNRLPAFRITTPLADEGSAEPNRLSTKAPPFESQLTIAIDEANDELLIDGPPGESNAAVKLLRMLDRPLEEEDPVQLTASSKYVCQIADQLPAEIERLRAAKQGDPAAKDPLWVAQQEGAGARRAPLPNMNPAIGEVLGNLKAEVNIQSIPDLNALIIRGNKADVEQVMKVIRELEKLSEATAPKVHLLYLKNVDAESLSELLTTVYDRLTKFPGTGTQARQSAAILPITKPNSLLIIAPESDLRAILDLAEELDRPVDPLTEFQVFHLKSAIATQVEQMLTQFYLDRRDLGTKVLLIADTRANALIVRAQPRDLDEISALIRKIDRDDPEATSTLRIFPLKNAIATELAAVINAAIHSVLAPPTASGGGGGQQGFGGAPTGLSGGQVDEQFKNVKSQVLQLFNPSGSGDKLRSGILSDIRITPDSHVNSLLVTASETSMNLIAELIKQLDRPASTVSEIKVFTLANADAELMVAQLNALFNNQQQGQGQGQGGNQQRQNLGFAMEGADDSSSSLVPLKFSVDKRTNSVIAVGAREALGVVEAILLRLDESDLRARQNVVIRLQNSQATLIAQSIAQFYQSQRDIAQTDPNLMSSVEQLEKEVVVVPDATNNSLLLSATPRYFKNIENMILKLDSQPRQVIIQALLVEVELDNTDEFGIELGFQDPILFNRSIKDPPVTLATTATSPNGVQTTTNTILSQSGQPGFNFNNTSLPLGNNLATVPGTVAAQGLSNFSLGRVNSELGFGGLVLSAGSDAVNVLIRALSAHRKITVLSRPQIRALDNQMAEVFSGQTIPVITGFQSNANTGTNSPVITQKDAGVQLQVMPRITADGNVVMQLYAQRSQYRQQGVPLTTDATGKTVSSPILDISRLQTVISIPTGNTVVIGGLINTKDEAFTNKAPFLAEIPLLGSLFRYDSRTTRRTELLVFLTPRIISGPLDEETIKDVEMGRIHFIECEAEELHGPLRSVPAEVFGDPKPTRFGIPNTSPNSAPPPAPAPDMSLPPAPPPAPDPNTGVIRDSEFNPVSARIRYTEDDDTQPTVQQAKAESKSRPPLFGRKPKKPVPAAEER